MSKLRLAHITDLHARQAIHGSCSQNERRSRDMFILLEKTLAVLKTKQVDFLAVTGDLLDVPLPLLHHNGYYKCPQENWLPLVLEDYRALKRILDDAAIPYCVLPGNHDLDSAFWEVFDPEPLYFDLEQGYRLVRFYDREWDFCMPRRVDRERKLMEQMLADEKSLPQIHLQHYNIEPKIDHPYPHNYYEHEHLKKQLIESPQVIASISGHYHCGTELLNCEGTTFTTGLAFAEFPHSYRIYEFNEAEMTCEEYQALESPMTTGKPVVFLDRDGVINDLDAYSTGPEEMSIIPGSAEAIQKLHEAGYVVVVITSQSGVGRGYVPWYIIPVNHEAMSELLVKEAGEQAQPDAIFFSQGTGDRAIHPSYIDESDAKPAPTMLLEATELLGLNPQGSWMVGDRLTDIQAGQSFGAKTILVKTGRGAKSLDSCPEELMGSFDVAENLNDALKFILP